jgi:prepilin-type processing-associated H-X9-DG protein
MPPGITNTGPVWYRSQISLRQISDGTSKVYMIGEKYMDQFTALVGTDNNSDENNLYSGFSQVNMRLTSSAGIYAPNAPSIGAGGAGTAYGSPFRYPPQQDSATWPANMFGNGTPPGVTAAQCDYFNGLRFGSAHAGGFNMAFCDGSVHTVLYEIDPQVHAMLGDRQDGKTIDASQYLQ